MTSQELKNIIEECIQEYKLSPDDNDDIHVVGYGIVKANSIKTHIKSYLEGALDSLAKEDWDAFSYYMKNGVLTSMADALINHYR